MPIVVIVVQDPVGSLVVKHWKSLGWHHPLIAEVNFRKVFVAVAVAIRTEGFDHHLVLNFTIVVASFMIHSNHSDLTNSDHLHLKSTEYQYLAKAKSDQCFHRLNPYHLHLLHHLRFHNQYRHLLRIHLRC
jgi:hypothetical protein